MLRRIEESLLLGPVMAGRASRSQQDMKEEVVRATLDSFLHSADGDISRLDIPQLVSIGFYSACLASDKIHVVRKNNEETYVWKSVAEG